MALEKKQQVLKTEAAASILNSHTKRRKRRKRTVTFIMDMDEKCNAQINE